MNEEERKRHLVSMSCFGLFETDAPCDLIRCAAKEICKKITYERKTKAMMAKCKVCGCEPKQIVNAHDVQRLLKLMGAIFEVKNEKYGNSFETSVDKYGMIAALTRISDKFNRIENLILNDDNGTDDESLRDTLIDMANYCVMTAVYLDNSGGKREKAVSEGEISHVCD